MPCLTYDTPELFFNEATKSHELRWTPTPSQVIAKQVAEMIAADREGKVREALIALGWTPPPERE
jgi:hypothetical protein